MTKALVIVIAVILAVVTGMSLAAPAGESALPCAVFPADNIWNVPVNTLPLDPRSADYIARIGATAHVHPDFGTMWAGAPNGIPYVVVPGNQPQVPIEFRWPDESDPGPYPIPTDAPIEGGPNGTGDRHVLALDGEHCMLYEMYRSFPTPDGSWHADSGAKYNLFSHVLRPAGWTSADAAGLPILPGLVRYDETMSGEIRHAIRFTAPSTQRAYVWPARHYASSITDPTYPPMGQRFRLRADYPLAGFPFEAQVILQAMKTYGIILADNGSAWYISGAPDPRWSDDNLATLSAVHGSDFEAVDVSSLMIDPDSGQTNIFLFTQRAYLPLARR